MKDRRNERFEYVIDLENLREHYGVWNLRTFRDRNTALAYAESLALNNADMAISVGVVPLDPKKNVLKTR